MASGVAVVAPALGGPLDLVGHERTGLLVPPFEAAGFTAAISALAGNPDMRAAFGIAGRVAIEGRSWSTVGDELIGHYRAAMATMPGKRVAVVV
jgi:phosphatidylinositol alpha 1,6-mannosyltransferase